jgi:mono/diheme cytochrome c family protein
MLKRVFVIALLSISCAVVAARAAVDQTPTQKPAAAASGWQLPPDADEKKSPLTADTKILATGKTIFKDKCSKCHGQTGLGDGPDADPDHVEHMNLTNPKFADRNSDGVVFYKVSNGRRRPKMPAFKEELTEQQIWSVVAYVQTLRKK